MNDENSQKLRELYPSLFFYPENPTREFYFECNDGWFEILKECILSIKEICEKKDLSIRATQIKEKYGSLRFYVDLEPDDIKEVVLKAKVRSRNTCENCGRPGELLNRDHWLLVRCEGCLNPLEKS